MADSSVGRADSQRAAVELVARAISKLCSFVHQLIEGWEDVVSKLHLGDGSRASRGVPDSKASDTLLTKRSVEYSVGSVLLVEVHRAPEHSSKLNILSEQDG